jgi:hypothetical protein
MTRLSALLLFKAKASLSGLSPETTTSLQQQVIKILFGTGLEPNWNRFETRLEPVWNQFGTSLEPVWNRFGTSLEPFWNWFGTGLELVWNQFRTGLEVVTLMLTS